MTTHLLQREQWLNTSLDEAWAFFSSPKNLDRITPPDLRFRITSEDIDTMYAGQILTYRIKAVPGLWQNWVTEIKHVSDRAAFVDEQRFGPYQFWHHHHRFEARDGGVFMVDRVFYRLPFGPLGNLVHALYVKKKLNWIFDFRYQTLEAMFNQSTAPKSVGQAPRLDLESAV
ncbi:SRPBCC family protein [Acanthopleuribacter pedis]|uniref:SRPBCC family protein n=1 Tax=Acanthopleuribacter pedis TaxID=442870 RepID=A0A8J7QE74_9BACT|nr:SRPBCC family protein [Acanthopleuribacter pedis]MBO1322569.1 SRPBCC family protein [Acanthopleuribacter pedis]